MVEEEVSKKLESSYGIAIRVLEGVIGAVKFYGK